MNDFSLRKLPKVAEDKLKVDPQATLLRVAAHVVACARVCWAAQDAPGARVYEELLNIMGLKDLPTEVTTYKKDSVMKKLEEGRALSEKVEKDLKGTKPSGKDMKKIIRQDVTLGSNSASKPVIDGEQLLHTLKGIFDEVLLKPSLDGEVLAKQLAEAILGVALDDCPKCGKPPVITKNKNKKISISHTCDSITFVSTDPYAWNTKCKERMGKPEEDNTIPSKVWVVAECAASQVRLFSKGKLAHEVSSKEKRFKTHCCAPIQVEGLTEEELYARWPNGTPVEQDEFEKLVASHNMLMNMVDTESKGAQLIASERQRQQEEEGYDDQHDADHGDSNLLHAALCYLANANSINLPSPIVTQLANLWPWETNSDKREKHGTLRSLTIAGALIAADIDRILHMIDGCHDGGLTEEYYGVDSEAEHWPFLEKEPDEQSDLYTQCPKCGHIPDLKPGNGLLQCSKCGWNKYSSQEDENLNVMTTLAAAAALSTKDVVDIPPGSSPDLERALEWWEKSIKAKDAQEIWRTVECLQGAVLSTISELRKTKPT